MPTLPKLSEVNTKRQAEIKAVEDAVLELLAEIEAAPEVPLPTDVKAAEQNKKNRQRARQSMRERRAVLLDVACDECNQQLIDPDPGHTEGKPLKRYAWCPACGYQGWLLF